MSQANRRGVPPLFCAARQGHWQVPRGPRTLRERWMGTELTLARRPRAHPWPPSPGCSVSLLLRVLVCTDSKGVPLTGRTGSQVGGDQEQGCH